jgi:MFS family permease
MTVGYEPRQFQGALRLYGIGQSARRTPSLCPWPGLRSGRTAAHGRRGNDEHRSRHEFLGLIGVAVGAFSAQGVFWALPATYLAERARPIGFALVNTVGMLGQSVGPYIIGALKDLTQSFNPGLLYVVLVIGFSIVCIFALAVSSRRIGNLQLQPDIS